MSESRRTGPNTPPGDRLVAAPRRTRSECRATSFSCASFVTTSCAPTMRSPARTMYLLGSTLRRNSSRRRAALVGRGLRAREKGEHGDLRAVEGPLLILIDRLHGARELLRFARELLIGLVDGERKRGDHVAIRHRTGREQRRHVGGARGEDEVSEQRQAHDPRPAAAVIAQLLFRWQPHVSLVRPRRTLG